MNQFLSKAVALSKACAGLTLLMTLGTGEAHAQMPGMGGGGGGMNMGHARDRSDDGKANQACASGAGARPDPVEDARSRLQELRSKINLTNDQISLWNKYDMAASRAIDDSARWHNRDHRGDRQHPATELDSMLLEELRDRLTALEDVESTSTTLYRTLDADQKELADRQMPAIVSALAGNPALSFDGQ